MSDLHDQPAELGIFGGSFDPPHVGHVLLVAYVLSATDVDAVYVVPAWQHPFDKPTHASFEQRVHMCELAMGAIRGAEVSRVEEELGGKSRTVHTLEELTRRYPDTRLRLLLGSDLVAQTPSWHRWERIAELAPPLVVGRAGYSADDAFPVEMPEVSSTEIRARLARARRTAGLVPRTVEDYIEAHGLYRG